MIVLSQTLDGYTLSAHDSVDAFPDHVWRACVGEDQPFVDQRHLKLLEKTNMVGEAAGITPFYLSLARADGTVEAIAPAFLKTHSRGELGIDWGLPMAHERVSGPYYPKLMVEVPLTPWSGPRLLVAAAQDASFARKALLSGLDDLALKVGAQSVQIAYGTREDQAAAQDCGYHTTDTLSFVWRSRGEATFEDFKAALSKRGRQRLRKEYLDLLDEGMIIKRVNGSDLTPDLIATLYGQYCAVYDDHKNPPWLSLGYFEQLVETMPENVELQCIWQDGKPLASLLCLLGKTTISAQHWLTESPKLGLLFPLMFHIYDEAIQRGYTAVDIGAVGRHKSLRGAVPEPVHHALKFYDPEFQALTKTILDKRNDATFADYQALAQHSPYQIKVLP